MYLPNFNPLLLLLACLPFSSSLSTFAISHISNKTLLVCALLPTFNNNRYHDLNCTSFPNGITTHHYPSGAHPYSAVAAGDGFLCGITSPISSNISSMKWWDFAHNPNKSSMPKTKRVYRGPTILDLSAGGSHVCGLTGSPRAVECWRWPQLEVHQGLNLTQIAVGGKFVCGLDYGGKITCFGDDVGGVVGNEPAGNFTALAAGTTHACGVSVYGELNCWGAGAPRLNTRKNTPPLVVAAMALGDNRTCVLDFNGTVHCCGDENFRVPEKLATSYFVAIESRGDTFCGVLMSSFSLVCWGNEIFEQKHDVFKLVLPGTCMTKCPCDPLPGTGNYCPKGSSVCMPCPVRMPSPNPNPNTNPPSSDQSSTSSSDRRRRLIFIILASSGLFIAFIALVSYLLIKFKLKNGRIHNSATNPPIVGPVPQPDVQSHLSQLFNKGHNSTGEEFPLGLLLEITNGFTVDQKIGSGSFGSVYRATLDDGRVVAVKRAESVSNNRRREKEYAFCAELGLLSRVNHKNLVRLFGYCKEGPELVLVYEFMSSGTLHDLLHKSGSEPGSPLGSWAARIRVALDAARGVEYLHSYAVPPIIHRDIKSSNILLADDWTAKVSDFGLSLLIPETCITADDSHLSPHTAGTVGYMDPEYYRLQHLTEKSDVYSFGVVLLEILTGCRVIKKYGESGTPMNVVEYAVPHIVGDEIDRVLDTRMALPTGKEIEGVEYVGYLAADCVSPEGRDRPTMREIVSGLERALAIISTQSSSSTTIVD